jgi:hypothetical protein
MFEKQLSKKNIFEFCLTPNPGISEYTDLAICLRIPTQDTSLLSWGGGIV